MASLLYETFSPLLNLLPERARILSVFLLKHRRWPRIESPRSFSELLQWRKLYDRNPLFPKMADKIGVKGLIADRERILKVPQTLWQGSRLSDFCAEAMPANYVLKASHASGTNYIVRNGAHPSQDLLVTLEKKWSRVDVAKTYVEWGYENVPVQYFAEEFLDFGTDVPIDYKLWVFSGRVEFVQVDVGRFGDHQRSFFDRNWNVLDFLLTYPGISKPITCPSNMNSMIDIAERLAKDVDYLRIDFYSNDVDVFFGEITMYPGSGYEKFSPVEADFRIGEMWDRSRVSS